MARPILEHFQHRLQGMVGQSSLLKVTIVKHGRIVDCSDLSALSPDLPQRLLSSIVDGGHPIAMDFRLGSPVSDQEPGDEDTVARKQMRLFESLEKRIRRHGQLAWRETGVHALWFGYPLLYVATGTPNAPKWILAPVFLWPVSVNLDLRREGRLHIGRSREESSLLPPKFNRALVNWIAGQVGVHIPEPTDEDLEQLNCQSLNKTLLEVASCFQEFSPIPSGTILSPVPSSKQVTLSKSPSFHNCAVLGYFRWPNEAILADLESLKEVDQYEGPVSAFVEATGLSEPPHIAVPAEHDRFLVTQADFSQEKVVWQSRCSPGLVVHGPPGTGKSQTIVNVIADALAHGRTVLMVCQKQAATRVVYERLRAAGLADLCLEVHDAEQDRLSVFKSIRDQVDQLPNALTYGPTTERDDLSRNISLLENDLDKHSRLLHEAHPKFGLSYRQMKAWEAEQFEQFNSVRDLSDLRPILVELMATQVIAVCEKLVQLGTQFQLTDMLHNPWRQRIPGFQMSIHLATDVEKIVRELRERNEKHLEHIRDNGLGIPLPRDRNSFLSVGPEAINRLRLFCDPANSTDARITKALLKELRGARQTNWDARQSACLDAENLAQNAAKTPLDAQWQSLELAEEDLVSLGRAAESYLSLRNKWWRILWPGYYQSRKAIAGYATDGQQLTRIATSLGTYCDARAIRRHLANANQHLVAGLRPNAADEAQQRFPGRVRKCLDYAQWLCRVEPKQEWMPNLLDVLLSNDTVALTSQLTLADRSIKRAQLVAELLTGLGQFKHYLKQEALRTPYQLILEGQSTEGWLKKVEAGVSTIEALIAYDSIRDSLDKTSQNLLRILEQYEARRSQGEELPTPPANLDAGDYGNWWLALVRFTAARAWQSHCQIDNPILVQLTPQRHALKVDELRRLLGKKRTCEAEHIRRRWLEEQFPLKNRVAWKQIFKLRSGKRGESKRLREAVGLAVDENGAILKMRPCWLVNPTAASQLFPLKPGLFDLVVFDEASQCPLEQALPAIYRGKVVVVSGDGKQLPPTSFFSARLAEDEADEEETEASTTPVERRELRMRQLTWQSLSDVEDLLQAAIELNFPEKYLLVHYRSEHEDLIRFSNHAFYNGALEAPPRGSPTSLQPIVYHEVNGIYDRRQNREEGKRVVALLQSFWKEEGNCPTIGVVTFNQPQRELIVDLIEKECHKNEQFAARFQQENDRKVDNQDVGFFVKNLENVQGDERDVMIFSTTFGKDTKGNFNRRFGPVGHVGGERRLNVAVTRAKKQIIVVGSMPIEQISLALSSDAGSTGGLSPRDYLQLYLAYARAVSRRNPEAVEQIIHRLQSDRALTVSDRGPDSPFEEQVRDTLIGLGHTVHCQVGDSGFLIDLAVQHPEGAHRGYLLAIECDGATYHSDRSARVRDVWRQDILESRGWRIHRIWSTSWWYNKHEETEKLKHALEQAWRSACGA